MEPYLIVKLRTLTGEMTDPDVTLAYDFTQSESAVFASYGHRDEND